MALVLVFLATASAYIAPFSNYTTAQSLGNQRTRLKVMFYDFDQTLVVGHAGDTYLGYCGGNCSTYYPTGPCPCNQTVNAYGDFFAANYAADVLGPLGFNGSDRRDRLISEFQHLQRNGVQLMVISTSWYYVDAPTWKYFLNTFFTLANISAWLNSSNIITLADAGPGIPSNKGGAMATYLAQHNLTEHDGLFADDSYGNINSSMNIIDWLYVQPRTGLALDAMQYIEARSDQFVPPSPGSGQIALAASAASLVLPLLLSLF